MRESNMFISVYMIKYEREKNYINIEENVFFLWSKNANKYSILWLLCSMEIIF